MLSSNIMLKIYHNHCQLRQANVGLQFMACLDLDKWCINYFNFLLAFLLVCILYDRLVSYFGSKACWTERPVPVWSCFLFTKIWLRFLENEYKSYNMSCFEWFFISLQFTNNSVLINYFTPFPIKEDQQWYSISCPHFFLFNK